MKKNNKKKNIFTKLFKVVLFLIGIGVVLFATIWLWWAHSISTITLKDLKLDSCSQLPKLSEVDAVFISNKEILSKFLGDLSQCENNIFVCDRDSKCIKKNYSKRTISSGNTIIEWKKVPECGNENKGAVLISHTSGCEIQKINNFLNKNAEFVRLPIDYYNY